MKKRILGKTGLEVSLLGFGGFHLLEIPAEKAYSLLTYYYKNGGNYIETAAAYGNGESERKIGPFIDKYRENIVLASKTDKRDAEGAMADINRSLENLQTDYLDIIFMHCVKQEEDLEKILSSNGALQAALEAKKEGKVRYIGITSHGQPDTLIEALKTDNFDVMMTHFNYFDKFNYPKLENELLSLVNEKNIGAICMKPLADGFLWQSVDTAFQYVFSLPVDMVVTGMNTMEILQKDLDLANKYQVLNEEEKEDLYKNAIELGDYICRQCNKCSVSENYGENLKEVFKLEGYYDRQMRDGKARNPAEFALRDRLRFWLGDVELAKAEYRKIKINAFALLDEKKFFKPCLYNLDIEKKLRIINYKLGDGDIY
ncbi:aldo/keto reductase [Natronospora cellulosivora (SeqCode)]